MIRYSMFCPTQAGGQHWLTEKNDEEPAPPVPPSVPTSDDKLYASGTSHETPLPAQPIHGKEASIGVRVAYTLLPDGGVRCDWDMDTRAALPAKLAGYLFPCALPLRAWETSGDGSRISQAFAGPKVQGLPERAHGASSLDRASVACPLPCNAGKLTHPR